MGEAEARGGGGAGASAVMKLQCVSTFLVQNGLAADSTRGWLHLSAAHDARLWPASTSSRWPSAWWSPSLLSSWTPSSPTHHSKLRARAAFYAHRSHGNVPPTLPAPRARATIVIRPRNHLVAIALSTVMATATTTATAWATCCAVQTTAATFVILQIGLPKHWLGGIPPTTAAMRPAGRATLLEA